MALTYHNNNSISNVTSFPQVPIGSPVLLSTATASASASIEFTSGIDSTYDVYKFEFINIHPSVNEAYLGINFSTDNGSNYNVTKTTTFFYATHNEADTEVGLDYLDGNDLAQSTAYQDLARVVGNDNDQSASGTLQLFNPSSSTYVKHFMTDFNSYHYTNWSNRWFCAGYGNTTSPINAINFKFSSGNIDDGIIKMYGVK